MTSDLDSIESTSSATSTMEIVCWGLNGLIILHTIRPIGFQLVVWQGKVDPGQLPYADTHYWSKHVPLTF